MKKFVLLTLCLVGTISTLHPQSYPRPSPAVTAAQAEVRKLGLSGLKIDLRADEQDPTIIVVRGTVPDAETRSQVLQAVLIAPGVARADDQTIMRELDR